MKVTNRQQPRSLARNLLILFIFSFLMSNGPGLALVNKPVLVAGIPLLYLWAFGWGLVQIGIILAAYFMIWRHELTTGPDQAETTPNGKERC